MNPFARISHPEAAGYSSRMKDRMTDEQRAELGRRAQWAIETQRAADDALAARDDYIIDLSDGTFGAKIGDTEIGRCIPGDDPDGLMNRVTVNRIVNNHKKREAKRLREARRVR